MLAQVNSLVPLLELDNVPLGIGHINQRQFACPGNIERYQLSHVATAACQDFRSFLVDVVDLERQMLKAGPKVRGNIQVQVDIDPQSFL